MVQDGINTLDTLHEDIIDTMIVHGDRPDDGVQQDNDTIIEDEYEESKISLHKELLQPSVGDAASVFCPEDNQ